jgi:hypothetical protein
VTGLIVDVCDANAPAICYSLEILHLIITSKDQAWVVGNIALIQVCLEKWISSDIAMIAKALLPIMGALFSVVVPLMPHPPPDAIGFIKYIDSVIRVGLASNVSITDSGKAYATALLMHSAYGLRKNVELGAHYPDISKLTQNLSGEESLLSSEALMLLLPLLKDRTQSMGGMW